MASKPARKGPTPDKPSDSSRTDRSGPLRPLKDRQKLDSVMDAVSSVELHQWPAWEALVLLSDHTRVEDIQAVPEGIFEVGERRFVAVATVYVDLEYGDPGDATSAAESFPAEVQGYFTSGKAIVDAVSVDTSAVDA